MVGCPGLIFNILSITITPKNVEKKYSNITFILKIIFKQKHEFQNDNPWVVPSTGPDPFVEEPKFSIFNPTLLVANNLWKITNVKY